MPRRYTMRSKEEKLEIVKQVLVGTPERPGNPLSRYERRKELTYEEQLQYQIELLKRELVKKEAEVLRLKKLNERKGGDAQRK